MSDDDFDMAASDDEYGFEYESGSEDEPDVELANQYHEGKELKQNPEEGIAAFEKVLELEVRTSSPGEWGFKALKQILKLLLKLNRMNEFMERYNQLLTYVKSAVTRNVSEKGINNILEYMSNTSDAQVLRQVYHVTLTVLEDTKNDRLWFKTNLKLGRLHFDRREFGPLQKILKALHQSCQDEDGADDTRKGTQLLEVYALEIQMYTEQKETKKLTALYQRATRINSSAIPHPLNLGIIRECGGKMYMGDGNLAEAYADFFEAFKNYDEAGSPRRIQCLKYLVLASMLMTEKGDTFINPFDSTEANPYKSDPEIVAMTTLVKAYQENDINTFSQALKEHGEQIMGDTFMRDYVEDLLLAIRTQYVLLLIKPYTRLHISFISKELNIPTDEVEDLLVALIMDERIKGQIDQVNQIVILEKSKVDSDKYDALGEWQEQLDALSSKTCSRLSTPLKG
ncbi:COP9 signalosome complex subunit 2 [Sphaeroforma arctica JP610]|uniref:COP9 signalosome complex subunit 2 n=1 Tax=Sphaeroforma arctica JP610 TaxID=667725 RepID=A0A0L0G4N0_9EUKA|nr:COP9 signalosome complex subunit 2 [Sphaeroforma arctica JP610]KNC83859.1 COP9 signalosome complex subunit 2 [Sphaeroforma arctica JP610]|eukprot:XP_014157761.1 COP9 signalosome complex subunit 2 [Sphaeroforma arctica JP610]